MVVSAGSMVRRDRRASWNRLLPSRGVRRVIFRVAIGMVLMNVILFIQAAIYHHVANSTFPRLLRWTVHYDPARHTLKNHPKAPRSGYTGYDVFLSGADFNASTSSLQRFVTTTMQFYFVALCITVVASMHKIIFRIASNVVDFPSHGPRS